MSEATQIASMGISTMIELMQAKDEIKRLRAIIAATEESSNAANAAATQEPVAWMQSDEVHISLWKDDYHTIPLYTHPPQRSEDTQQPKEEQDLDAICQDLQEKTYTQAMRIADLEKDLTVAYIRGHEDGMKAKAAVTESHKQEPVGQLLEEMFGRGQVMWFKKPEDWSMLYTHPPQRSEDAKQPKAEKVWVEGYGENASGFVNAHPKAEQEPVAGVVIREGNPTLLRDKDIKPTDKRLYTHPQQKAEQEPKQKAVGVVLGSYGEPSLDVRLYAELPAGTELWPDAQVQQKPKREPMTDEQVEDIYQSHSGYGGDDFWSFARAIEAAHGIYAPLKGEA